MSPVEHADCALHNATFGVSETHNTDDSHLKVAYPNCRCFLCPSKHPIKVHVWFGISKNGPTNVCIFEGKWMHHFFAKFFKEHSYLLFKGSFHLLLLTDLCRTMIPSTVLTVLSIFANQLVVYTTTIARLESYRKCLA